MSRDEESNESNNDSTPWSAATDHRYVPTWVESTEPWLRQVATGQSADKSAHSKELK